MKTTTALQVSLVIKMKHILFVCTGNTCRSPMAEAIFNSLTWEDGHFFATSCGIFADGVTPISDNAKIVLNELGITFNTVSTPISEQIMEKADKIICMTKNHASTLLSMFPQYGAKIFVMPKDITDPFGGDINVYRKCRDEISNCIEVILNELTSEYNA